MNFSLGDIEKAHAAIRGEIATTPFVRSQTLSDILKAQLYLKFENLQFTGSFKERGALNKILSLSPQEKAAGVIAVSAGNHAQGVAFHARRHGIKAVIVMPRTAPSVKIASVRVFGAEVILHGETFAEACEAVPALVRERGLVQIHPFDDPLVIAGQGTLGLEMLAAVPDLDALVVSVGGGGLIAGVATAAKAIKPGIKVFGVQTELYPGMAVAMGKAVLMPDASGASIAEGIAVRTPGALTSPIVSKLVDDVIVVRESTIEDSIAMLLEIEKTLCEGAGAAGIAAMIERPGLFSGLRVGTVLCGGNIDINVLSAALQRSLMRRGRVIRLSVTALDASGSLAEIARVIADASCNIRQVAHDRTFTNPGAKTATIIFEIETPDDAATAAVQRELEGRGMHVEINAHG